MEFSDDEGFMSMNDFYRLAQLSGVNPHKDVVFRTPEELDAQLAVVATVVNTHLYPNTLRAGQVAWNLTNIMLGDLVEPLRGTEVDCFYDDSKIDLFFFKVRKLIYKV